MERVLSGILALAASGAPIAAWGQERPWDWGWHPMWGFWGLGMMVFMLLFWAVVIIALVAAIRWLMRQGREPRREDAALEILRQRYARGEIGREEYETKKRDLS